MNKLAIATVLLAALAVPSLAHAERIKANLIGFEEVPAVSTNATGKFRAKINSGGQSIDFELTYSGLQGTVQQAHIHVAQKDVNGSIVIWLCGTTSNPGPSGTQTCPGPHSGMVDGTILASNVVAGSMAAQQLTAGDLAEVIRAIRGGVAYVNVHTDLSGSGEIRGQVRGGGGGDDDDDD